MSGIFISLDGVDGAGKSTQVKLLVEWFKQQGCEVLALRDPGGTKLGEALREILLHRQEVPLAMTAEMLMYMASRAQLVAEVIRPALARNQVVIADRYLLANVVYQGCAGGLDIEHIWQVGAIATGGLTPHLTCLLDLPVELAITRLSGGLDRLESRGQAYLQQVQQGYLQQIHRLTGKVAVIDAQQSPEQMHAQIVNEVLKQGLWLCPD